MKYVLFVCMGNICRSPAAECLMRKLVDREGLSDRVRCDSAGTIGYHEGKAPDARMRGAGARVGITINGAARQVRRDDFEKFDLILAMDEENMRDLRALEKNVAAGGEKLKRFCDFLTEHRATEVPDPYYGGDEGFANVLELLEDGCAAVLEELEAQLKAESTS